MSTIIHNETVDGDNDDNNDDCKVADHARSENFPQQQDDFLLQATRATVTRAMAALVQHYNQPVHYCVETTTTTTPYFDSLLGNAAAAPPIPPVVQYWLDVLLSLVECGDKECVPPPLQQQNELQGQNDVQQGNDNKSQENNNMGASSSCDNGGLVAATTEILVELLRNYSVHIRPVLWEPAVPQQQQSTTTVPSPEQVEYKTTISPTGIAVLTHYEILLYQYYYCRCRCRCRCHQTPGWTEPEPHNRRLQQDEDSDSSRLGSNNNNNNSATFLSESSEETILQHVLRILCHDITMATAVAFHLSQQVARQNDDIQDDDDNDDDGLLQRQQQSQQRSKRESQLSTRLRFHKVANVVLPTLIRILTLTLQVCRICKLPLAVMERSQDTVSKIVKGRRSDAASVGDLDRTVPDNGGASATVVATLLAFGMPYLGCRQLDPEHQLQNDLAALSQYYVTDEDLYPNHHNHLGDTNGQPDHGTRGFQQESLPPLPNIILSGMDWKAVEIDDGLAWDDFVTGITTRSAVECWKVLVGLLSDQVRGLPDSPAATLPALPISIREWQLSCLEFMQNRRLLYQCAKSVRAHFFGRNMMHPQDNRLVTQATVKTRLHLGREIVVDPSKESEMEKAWKRIPSRLYVVLQFVSLLFSPQLLHDKEQLVAVLDELLPVCYEILNSNTDAVIALGAAALFRMLHFTCSHGFPWPSAAACDNLLSVLDLAIKTCRHGPTLAVLGLAQRNLLRRLISNPFDNKYMSVRRKATQQWMTMLYQNQYKTGTPLVYGILLGAILPLLHDHVLARNADAMELGRLGLMALLPLLRNDDGSDLVLEDESLLDARQQAVVTQEIRLVAVVALWNLLLAAAPIMPRHGGKIMCELLACMGHLADQMKGSEEDAKKHAMQLVRHVAVIAVRICQDRAVEILNGILISNSDKNEYKEDFVSIVEEISNSNVVMRLPRDRIPRGDGYRN